MRLVVIGGGPAGVEAARAAAPHAAVTLVSERPVGAWRPLATWVWMAAAAEGERELPAIVGRAARAASAWQARCAAELAALKVAAVAGRARLGEPGEVLVEAGDGGAPQRLPADAVIIAAGASETFPAELAPDGEAILTDAQLSALRAIPSSALVLGDGPVGFELCHILSLLGAAVTWLVPEDGPRTRVAPEADGYLTRLLERRGVRVAPHTLAQQITRAGHGVRATTVAGEQHDAEIAALAFGRGPGAQAAGLAAEQAATDIYGQTQRRGVYLVGDALAPRAASIAMAEARAAALHAVGRARAPADRRHIVLAFMHRPQVAKLGELAAGDGHGSVTVTLAECIAAHATGSTEGFLTLAWDQHGRVAGALAVAPGAAEILAPVALAMRAGLRVEELAASYGPHPSLSELVALAARKAVGADL